MRWSIDTNSPAVLHAKPGEKQTANPAAPPWQWRDYTLTVDCSYFRNLSCGHNIIPRSWPLTHLPTLPATPWLASSNLHTTHHGTMEPWLLPTVRFPAAKRQKFLGWGTWTVPHATLLSAWAVAVLGYLVWGSSCKVLLDCLVRIQWPTTRSGSPSTRAVTSLPGVTVSLLDRPIWFEDMRAFLQWRSVVCFCYHYILHMWTANLVASFPISLSVYKAVCS